MTCPKCGSNQVVAAPDEAPGAALAWVRCYLCGKRWDAAGQLAKALELDVDPPAAETTTQAEQPADQPALLDLAMNDARVMRTTEKGETLMGRSWTPERRAKFQKTMAEKRAGKPDPDPPTRRGRRNRETPALPAVRIPAESHHAAAELLTAAAPIAPTFRASLDAGIAMLERDLDALKRLRNYGA